MQITIMQCATCGATKAFWLRSETEDGFRCKCGTWQIMRNYHSGGYEDYFIGLLRAPLTIENLLDLAEKEQMQIDANDLRQKLSQYDLDHLAEQEFYDVVSVVLASDDRFRFRKDLMRKNDQESLLPLIAQYNPRIDIPGLHDYLKDKEFPLSEEQVIEMEKAIEEFFYQPEIYAVSEW